MTITDDPHDPRYLDEASVRDEMTRVFDVCHGCRRCVDLCTPFPTLFEMIDRHPDRDAGRLTPAQQDQVVDDCHHCSACSIGCPYLPGLDARAIDVPRLMLRAVAMRFDTKQVPAHDRAATKLLARTQVIGAMATSTTAISSTANRLATSKPGGAVRTIAEKATGISSRRRLPTFARQRFSTWFKRRPTVRIGKRQGKVALFPTCLVEYQAPSIGHDVVKVYERNGIEVSLAAGGCCGAPWLHAGDRDRFVKAARRNVAAWLSDVRAGKTLVVPQAMCSHTIRQHYPAYVPGADAVTVAANTADVSEYLMRIHRDPDTSLDVDFDGDVPTSVTYHAPTLLRAQNIGLRSRDLLKLTGARISLVQRPSAMDAMWGLRARNADVALDVAAALAVDIERAGGEVVAGDCHLANTAITEQTGRVPVHPIQVIARAYGIGAEDDPG